MVDEIGMSSAQILCFDDMILKVERQCEESENEYRMMQWLRHKIPVPEILYYEQSQHISYLLMSKLRGEMLCSSCFLTNPHELIRMLAEGLKLLWSVDISSCPCNNAIENKLRLAESRVKDGLCSVDDSEPETYGANGFKSPSELLEWLKCNKPTEEYVFSHGDFCLPNIFSRDGKIEGFLDLGRSGIADRYQDIALCYRSLKDNFDGRYGGKLVADFDISELFSQLQIEPNWEKIHYYILLDELF